MAIPRRIASNRRWTRTGNQSLKTLPMTGGQIAVPEYGFDNQQFHWIGTDNPSWFDFPSDGLKLAAVGRALELIAGSIAAMPWRVKRGDSEYPPVPPWIEDPQLSRWDGRVVGSDTGPDYESRLTAMAFREELVGSVVLYGNGYVYVPVRDAKGQPVPPLFLMHPDAIDIRDGRYWVDDYVLPVGSVIHVRGRGPFDEHGRGTGVLRAYAQAIGLLDATQRYSRDTFKNPVPAGVLETSTPNLTQEQADQLKAAWMRAHYGDQRSIAVLNSTVAFRPLSLSPIDAEVVKMSEVGLRDVALAFGLDPSWFGVPGGSLTYNTVVLKSLELRQFGLLNWVRRIESAFDAQLPKGTELDIVMDGLERGSTQERYANYEAGLRAGFLSKEEVRATEGLPPLPVGSESSPRELAEIVQKLYLGVGKVLSPEEARRLLREAGVPLPDDIPADAVSELKGLGQ